MIRTPLALVPYLIAVAAVVGGLLWHAGDAAIESNRSAGIADVGGPFTLTDQNGKARSDSEFRGRYLIVYFGYTDCPDVCPTTLGVIADAMEKLGPARARFAPLFISVDPERDTPGVLKSYLKSFGPDLVGLTGTVAQIRAIAQEYRVYFTKHPLPNGGYSVDHSSVIYLMDPNGKFVTYYDDASIGPDALAKDLRERL